MESAYLLYWLWDNAGEQEWEQNEPWNGKASIKSGCVQLRDKPGHLYRDLSYQRMANYFYIKGQIVSILGFLDNTQPLCVCVCVSQSFKNAKTF